MSKKVLIVGGVAGGASAATRLRRLDEEAEIVLFERGKYISYANCGLPYYIGDVIKDREALLVQTPEKINGHFDIDVRVENEVLSVDKENKKVAVKNLQTGEEYEESYDVLILATGSSPIRPPIEGIDSEGIYTLWNVPDVDRIKAHMQQKNPKRAAVVGGGFIGLEMSENLHRAGLEVTVIEMLDQVMAPIDYEMAQLVEENMVFNGVALKLGDGVKRFEKTEQGIHIHLQSGDVVETDMVILSIGVRPNSELARNANLALNERGGVVVDEYMRTSDPSIYAVGDIVEIEEFVSKGRAMIPLGGPANKQARICANNIASKDGVFEAYRGTQGTSVAQIFDLTVASTGINEKTMKRWGKKYGEDYYTAIISQKSHGGYYPGATLMHLKLVFDKTGKIYGAQIVGQGGVDKRIDTIATTMRLGGGVASLMDLELAYAPPYSSAKDPVNMLGFVADNVLKGLVSFVGYDEVDRDGKYVGGEEAVVLDVREEEERAVKEFKTDVAIPLSQLRERYHELDPKKLTVLFCPAGIRAYSAARVLAQKGFEKVKIYPGGVRFHEAQNYRNLIENTEANSMAQEEKIATSGTETENYRVDIIADCSGMQCPGPLMKVYGTMKDMAKGEILKVTATDFGFGRDVEAWSKRTGNTLLKVEKDNSQITAYVQKGTETQSDTASTAAIQEKGALPQGKTIIVFSGDMDKVMASFIIANGAAAMGREVTMFFTFWGLNVLRKSEKQQVKKSLISSMFGKMMPRGAGKLKISKMNMGGMGTSMMKKVMRDKRVDSLETLIENAKQNGVKLIACTMSMDVMGITKEELMDGVEYAGVGTYLGDAEESNVNLFI
ncbi:MAG: FAD-dependent oxidoreductase [Eubacteriales bacterium]|jgi:NADPH-dependent 2,4-dienoyl-CoA reductase/sulfur reductase-like enzyme/peroxiredoxin family protein/TusA-related sulfurtransferase/rhodanese-related sulfurtransferase